MFEAEKMMDKKNLVIFYIIKGTNESGAILWKPGENANKKILEATNGRPYQVIKITDLYGKEKKSEKEEERWKVEKKNERRTNDRRCTNKKY